MTEYQDTRPLDPVDERDRVTGVIRDRAEGELSAAAIHVADQWWSGVLLVGDMSPFEASHPMSLYNGSEVRLIVGSSFDGTRQLAQLSVAGAAGTLRSQYPLTPPLIPEQLSQESAERDEVLGRILARTVFQFARAEKLRDQRINREVEHREPRNAGQD